MGRETLLYRTKHIQVVVIIVIRIVPAAAVFLPIIQGLENLEMSGNLTAVREMLGILLKMREMSGKKSCGGKVA